VGVKKCFFFSKAFHINAGPHPGSYSMCTGVLSPEAKLPEREVNHSPLFTGEAKNEWSYNSALHIRHHGVHREENLYF
jgi:hypothetical protein